MTSPFWRRPLVLALVVSIALNAFFAFALIGHLSRGDDDDRKGSFRDRFVAGASEDVKQVVFAALDVVEAEIEATRNRSLAARRLQMEILTADPFDADAFEAAQAEDRAASMARREALHRAFATASRALDLEDRKMLAIALEERLRRWERRRAEREGRSE